jgi:hypothetical protein
MLIDRQRGDGMKAFTSQPGRRVVLPFPETQADSGEGPQLSTKNEPFRFSLATGRFETGT